MNFGTKRLVLKICLCFDTWCRVLCAEDQNSRRDNLCKSDVQVDIYLNLLLIKLNPVVFLLIPKV